MQTDSERPYLPPIAAAAEQQRPGGKKRTLDVRKGLYLRSSHDVVPYVFYYKQKMFKIF